MHGDDAVHAREIEREPAEGCVDVTFERGAGAEGDDRHARFGAQPHHVGDFSAVVSANSTASGGSSLSQVSVLACCSRSAWLSEKRLPKRAARVANSASLPSPIADRLAPLRDPWSWAAFYRRMVRKSSGFRVARRRPRRARPRNGSSPPTARSRARSRSDRAAAPRGGTRRRRCRADPPTPSRIATQAGTAVDQADARRRRSPSPARDKARPSRLRESAGRPA